MAVKTVSNTGGNWNSAATWSPSGVPSTTADNVVFTSTSGPLTISATATIENINFSNYQNTVTFNWPLQVTGAFNLGTESYTMSFDSTLDASGRPRGRIRHTDTATITTNNRPWQTPWQFYGTTETVTLSGNLILEQNFYLSHTGTLTLSGGSIITRKNLIVDSTGGITTGGATISMSPTIYGTWSSSGGVLRNNLILEPATASAYIYIGKDVYYGQRTIYSGNTTTFTTTGPEYLYSDNIIADNSTLHLETSCAMNNGVYWNKVLVDNASVTLRLWNTFRISGTLSVEATGFSLTASSFTGSGMLYYDGDTSFGDRNGQISGDLVIAPVTAAITFTQLWAGTENLFNPGLYVRDAFIGSDAGFNSTVNRGNIYVLRNLIISNPTYDSAQIISGTTQFVLTGTQSGCIHSFYKPSLGYGGPTYPTLRNNITIQKFGGTLYLGELLYQTGTITYTAGTLVNGVTFSNVGLSGFFISYSKQRLIINNTAATINVNGHNWDIIQLGYRWNEPANMSRNLTYDWITNELWWGPVSYIELSGTYSMYVRRRLVGGDYDVADYSLTQLTGSASIYLGDKDSISSSDIEIGTKYGYGTYSGSPIMNAFVSNPITINTTGKLKMYTSSTNFGHFRYYKNTSISNSGNFRCLSGTTNFRSLDLFEIYSDSFTSNVNLTPNSLTFSSLLIYATGSNDLNLYLGSSLTASSITFEPYESRTLVSGLGSISSSADINIIATGSTIYADTINFESPGTVTYTDSTITDEKLICRDLKFTSPVYLYNTIDDISLSDVGAASSTITHPTIFMSNGTYSVETNCKISGTTYVLGDSTLYWRPGNIGLQSGTLHIGSTTSSDTTYFKGDIRASGTWRFTNKITTGGTVSFGTSSFYLYDDISYFWYLTDKIRFNNFYFVGNLYSNSSLTYTSILSPYYGTFSANNFTLSPRYFTKALELGTNTVLDSVFTIGTLSFATSSGFTLGVVRYRNIPNTIDYSTSLYIDNYFGSDSSSSNYYSTITISSTWSSSNSPVIKTSKIILNNNAVQDLQYVNAERIDSSEGATVWTYKGNITNSYNWNQLPTQPRTISYSSSS
jgi:hypothetical protein